MKKILIYIMIILPFTSCKKVLDTVPTGALVPQTSYSSEAQVRAALAGLYFNLRASTLYGSFYATRLTLGTDETYFYNLNYGYNNYSYTIVPSTDGDIGTFWRLCYQSINYCNSLLDNIDVSAASGTVSAATVRKAKGEALFLRGYYYFLLAQWYGDVPLMVHATQDPSEGQIERTPVKLVYDQIISDMTAAEGMLTDQTFASIGYSEKISVTAVEGILARVCLYAAGNPVNDTKRFADAKKWAAKVIESRQHTLLSSYQQVFLDEIQNRYNQENIWEIGFNQNATGAVSAGGQFNVFMNIGKSTGSGSPVVYDGYSYGYVRAYPRLYVSYQPGDLRRDWNLSSYGWAGLNKTYYTSNQIWSRQISKWNREYEPDVSRLTQTTSQVNFPMLRYSDVLLMYAEAENELNGPTAEAYNAINQVRRRAYSKTPIIYNFTITNAGSGYTTAPAVNFSTGNATAVSTLTSGAVSLISVTNAGSGYITAPTVIIGTPWAANTNYALNTQVTNAGKLYTVTKAGVSTATPPAQASGASNPATTGATFTYAGVQATATANLTTVTTGDLTQGLSKDDFRIAVQNERYLELAFEALRKSDLKRWGIFVPTVQSLLVDIAGSSNPKWNMPIPPMATEITAADVIGAAAAPGTNIGSKDILWPIPQNEILLNKKIKQNPGY
ncbi:RagB/SusD family nutrient uptake outer membrane protein [Mucilaginibacter sp. PAMB04168]|uniref:RagB/SusD family nutrient uptake outer membrane protein n=1 Tax=Mucilaginibacter sp. PAMB04168 TaxID=3138567 RepID=UPI0031F6C561